jgi:hypothetical protein
MGADKISVMSIFRIAASLYVLQAAVGFATGFAIPWLQYFSIGGY